MDAISWAVVVIAAYLIGSLPSAYVAGRILDCSFGAAKKLGFVGDGTAPVKIEILEWGDGEYMHHDYKN